MNASEQLVSNLCLKSFLSLWAFPNPVNKDKKELCDVLVVCEPHIIIFSVKEIEMKDNGRNYADWERWNRRAIISSVKQIYGAERHLLNENGFHTRDGKEGLELPNFQTRKIHRMAIALGSQGAIPIASGDYGKGFVHVLIENTLNIIMEELNTIEDFTRYFELKENMMGKSPILINGNEEDLMALYLKNSRNFTKADVYNVQGFWSDFISRPEYRNKCEEDKVSYVWDNIINRVGRHTLRGTLETKNELKDDEKALRVMAKENRFNRRMLGQAFSEFVNLSSEKVKKIESRMLASPSGTTYVFLAKPHGYSREKRIEELKMRCFIARGVMNNKTVIGIATEAYREQFGHSLEICYLYMDQWTNSDQDTKHKMQNELGFFKSSLKRHKHYDEYPVN